MSLRTAVWVFGGLLISGCSDSVPDGRDIPGGTGGTAGSSGLAGAGTSSGGGTTIGAGGASPTAGNNGGPGGFGTAGTAAGSTNGGASSGSSSGGSAAGGSITGGTAAGGTFSVGGFGGGAGFGGVTAGGGPPAAGTSAGGSSSGGTPAGGAGAGGAMSSYPCNGTTSGYDAVMTKSGSTWTVVNGSRQVHSGGDMEAALRAAYGSLTPGRTTKQRVLVQGSGDISANSQVSIPSYTVLNVCGSINVTGTRVATDRSPLYARNARDIEIPNVKMTGTPQYGIFLRQTNNVHLGNVDLRLSPGAGIGIRADNAASMTVYYQNLRIDYVYGSGMDSHVVETVGINNIQIGTVEGNDVGECGVLLNRSTNATVDLVSCTNCATGVGYAAFRMANRNGAVNGSWDQVNVVVRNVVARGGGRGVFCVSESGAARIDHVDIEDTGGNSILIENCYNVKIGSANRQSRVASSGELRVAARTEFANSRDLTFENIAVSGTPVRESPCATNSTWINVTSAPTNCN